MYQSVTELDNMNLQRESVWNRQEKLRYKMDSICSPYGSRTRVTALRGRRPNH